MIKIAFRKLSLLALVLAGGIAVSGCTDPILVGPQVPGREGLLTMLSYFETGTKWRNWSVMLETFYLPDHASEVKKSFGSDLRKWFRSDRATAALTSGEIGTLRHLCVLALREKHFSPRFEPHYVVYYRVQKEPCQPELNSPVKGLDEGQMEWGFETKQRRWVHLRSLG